MQIQRLIMNYFRSFSNFVYVLFFTVGALKQFCRFFVQSTNFEFYKKLKGFNPSVGDNQKVGTACQFCISICGYIEVIMWRNLIWNWRTSMEMKYICDIYNFWPRKYILASFKYMSSVFQMNVRYILANIYIKHIWNIF